MSDHNSDYIDKIDNGEPFRSHRDPAVARVSLGRAFLLTLADDFVRHGQSAIELLRKERLHDYVKLVAALLPKEFPSARAALEDMPDDEFDRILKTVQSLVAAEDAEHDKGDGAAPKQADTSE